MAQFDLQIVFAGFGSHLDLFYLEGALLFFGLLQFFGQLVLVTAVIHNLADGRDGIGRNLHQVEAEAHSRLQCLGGRNDTNLVAVGIDQADLPRSDIPIDVGSAFGGSACLS
jgi:hypothetical protein